MVSNSDKKISVIVPTYQRYDYLELTLKSILEQTHQNLELLVVADGDDPDTATVVSSLGDPRARYLFTEHGGRPAIPRNEGLRQASGDVLAFCDDDDIWLSRKLESQLSTLTESVYLMCTTDYCYIDENGDELDRTNCYEKYFGPIDWRMFFHSMGFICNSAVIFSRKAFEKVGFVNEAPELRAYEDFEYWMRMLYRNKGFFISRKLVSYRVHSGSIQKDSPRRVFEQRVELHRSLKNTLQIPKVDYVRKYCKLACHYGFDRWPGLKKVFRGIQGRPVEK